MWGLKPWSILYDLNCFIHELLDPPINSFKKNLGVKQWVKKCSNFSLLTPRFFGITCGSKAGLSNHGQEDMSWNGARLKVKKHCIHEYVIDPYFQKFSPHVSLCPIEKLKKFCLLQFKICIKAIFGLLGI